MTALWLLAIPYALALTAWPLLVHHDRQARKRRRAARANQPRR